MEYIWNGGGMPSFHGLFHGLLFGWVPTHVSIPYPPWIPYGMSMEYTIPYGFHGQFIWIPYGIHGISYEFKFQIHVLFHKDSMDSMEQSIWIP